MASNASKTGVYYYVQYCGKSFGFFRAKKSLGFLDETFARRKNRKIFTLPTAIGFWCSIGAVTS
jgi:hypothetical protein